MAMKMAEIQKAVKETVFAPVKELFTENGEEFKDYSIAVPVTLDGVEYWAKVEVSCGQIKDTKTSKAFDPFALQAEWLANKEFKAKEAEAKAKAKAEKIARSKSKSKTTEQA